MSKKQETTLNVYTLIILNLLFWICGNTPRKIINFDDISSVASYIVHFLYFALFAFFIVIAFAKDKTVFSEKTFDKNLPIAKRWEFGKWISLLLLQIGLDCAVGLLSSMNVQWKYIGIDMFIPLYWVILYFICVGKRHFKKDNAKIFIFELLFILCFTIGSLLITGSVIDEYVGLIPKYEIDSPVLSAVKSNAEFLHGIKTALVDTVIGISLLVMNRVFATDENKTERCNFTVFSTRMLVIGAVLFICIFPKAIYPDGLLSSFRMHTSDHTSYQHFDECNETSDSLFIYRLSSEQEKIFAYQKDKITLSIDGKTSLDFTMPYVGQLYPYHVKDNTLDENFFLYPILSDEMEVYIYNSQIICFYENEMPRMIKVDDIKHCDENKILTQVCKKLLSEGNIYIFEYAAEYLERCEPNFIADYIKRYANGISRKRNCFGCKPMIIAILTLLKLPNEFIGQIENFSRKLLHYFRKRCIIVLQLKSGELDASVNADRLRGRYDLRPINLIWIMPT